jgi:hypothetical protein
MKKIIIIVCLLQSFSLYAQRFYFIRAEIDENYSYSSPPNVQLIKYNPMQDTSLLVIKDYTKLFSTSYNQLSSIIYYPSLHSFCFTIRFHSYFILNTNQPDTLKELIPECPQYYGLPSDIGVINNYWTYECFNGKANQKKDVFVHKGVDSSLTRHFAISPHDYKDIYLTGMNTQRVIVKPNDKFVYLPVVADTLNRPVLSIELPQKYWVKEKTFKTIRINDEKQMVLAMEEHKPKTKDDYGSFCGIIYNKRKNEWSEFALKGNASSVQAWGNWLAGIVRVGRGWSTDFKDNPSPGKEIRDNVYMENSFDERMLNYGIYCPGILYLFNTDTEKYIEWNTHQGDSEILLVQDEIVYYRVFDEIYKAAIIAGESLGKPELLAKDNQVVPQIHWAFFGKSE